MPPTIGSIIRPLAIRLLLAREWLQSRVTYNPLAPSFFTSPYPAYRALREKDPVHWSPLLRGWVCSSYEHIDAILRDHKRFSSNDVNATRARRTRANNPLGNETRSILFVDPPDHTRMRALVSRAFTPPAIEAMRPRIQTIVDELLDPIADGSTVDIIDALAYPLPVIVIAEMLGVPAEDRAQFKAWSSKVARTLEPTITAPQRREAQTAAQELEVYFRSMMEQRRRSPGDDLMSVLLAAEEQGETLSEAELLVTLRLLLVAGNETTTNLIANGLLALLRHPDELARLRDDPTLMETAVEELLRYDGPVQTDGRTALVDVKIGGRRIRGGESLVLLLGAANRDPAVFADPDRLDLARDPNPHIAFGRGIHHCLGAPLARVEGRIAFEALLTRFGTLELATKRPQFKDHIVLRGMIELPVRVGN